MIRKGLIASATAWLALTGFAVQAQDVRPKSIAADCVPAAEAEALLLNVAPAALREITRFCEAELPGDAYLRSGKLLPKFETAAKASTAAAEAAMVRIMNSKGGAPLPPSQMLPMFNQMIGPMLEEELKVQDCASYDRGLRLLDPLPAENTAALIIMAAQLGMKDTKTSKLPICPMSNDQ